MIFLKHCPYVKCSTFIQQVIKCPLELHVNDTWDSHLLCSGVPPHLWQTNFKDPHAAAQYDLYSEST